MDTQTQLIAGQAQAPRHQWYVIASSCEVGRDPPALFDRYPRFPSEDQVAFADAQTPS